jgi:hypothetical protein
MKKNSQQDYSLSLTQYSKWLIIQGLTGMSCRGRQRG